jgi:predicted Zn-dependent protease
VTRPFVTALLGLFLVACATTALQPIRDANVPLEEDEKRMWARVEQEQEKFEASGNLYRDAELEAYLTGVARKLQPPAVLRAIPFRVAVVKNPWLNAFAMPNGALYIHSGLLARLENEAQFAAVLGHEMVHVTHRHAIREFRSTQNKAAFLSTMSVTFGGVPVLGGIADLVGAFGTTAAITGYARDQEREADREGLDLMVQAGYDPTEAPKAFYEMKKEMDQEKIKELFFYSSHPRLQERIDNFESLTKTTYRDRQGGAKNADVFLKKIQMVVLENARLDLKAGRFHTARWGAEKYIAIRPNDPKGYYLLGEVRRQQAGEGDMQKAEQDYQKAVALDPAYPDPHKGLGLIQLRRGKTCVAKKSLESYLALAPTASDRAYIEGYIRQCAR